MNKDNAIRMLSALCIFEFNNSQCNDCIIKDTGGEICKKAKPYFSSLSEYDITECISQILDITIEENHLRDTKEMINHPSHYQGAHECIDVMRAMFGDEAVKGFCKCNAYKYRFRADSKNGEEDIRKAEWYEDYLIRMEKENESKI